MLHLNCISINILPAILIIITQTYLGRPSFRFRPTTTPDMVIFCYMGLSLFLLLLLETIRKLITFWPESVNRSVHTFIYVLYFSLLYAPSSIYLLYASYHLNGSIHRIKSILKFLIPVNIAILLVSASAPWTGFLYRIDERNTYIRSTGFFIFITLLFLLTLIGILFVMSGKKRHHIKMIRTLLVFPAIIILAGGTQILIYGISIVWPFSIMFVVIAAMNIQKNQKHIDHLTGLYNRRSFDYSLSVEIERSRRYASPLSLILLDIDHFKAINDEYGHSVGDQILSQIAGILTMVVRSTDFAARWGGEEFAILMPESVQEEAAAVAETLRARIENYTFVNDIRVTMSFGVAQWLKLGSKSLWFRRTDRALYRAKRFGRNRVEQCLWISAISANDTHLHWKKEYETGYKEVDKEHRRLIAIASRILRRPDSPNKLNQSKLDLKEILQTHFTHEEKLMRHYDYPQRTQHMKVHQQLLEQSLEAFSEIERGFYENFHFFLIEDLLIRHLFDLDRHLAEFLKRQTPAPDSLLQP
ncbi:MAG: diguanylate cyclase [Sphaerochaetaceae bacterium]|nr:diguanylate cyclase [Sphaerochaetaceae bacterium]